MSLSGATMNSLKGALMVDKERVVAGRYFKFKEGDRRVIRVESGQVHWVYADGDVRMGVVCGTRRLKHFANEAIEEFDTSETHKAIARDGFRAALHPRTKAEKLVVLASIIIFAILAPMIIHKLFG